MKKCTAATLAKKKLCNPPVKAKIESAEAMIASGDLMDHEVRSLIRADEAFVAHYEEVLMGAVKRLEEKPG